MCKIFTLYLLIRNDYEKHWFYHPEGKIDGGFRPACFAYPTWEEKILGKFTKHLHNFAALVVLASPSSTGSDVTTGSDGTGSDVIPHFLVGLRSFSLPEVTSL